MKFDDEAMWTCVTRHHFRLASAVKWLLAVALIITAVSAWRYVADCTATSPHFGTLDCARAWAGWTD